MPTSSAGDSWMSMSGLGRRMLENGIRPRPSRLTKVAAPRSPRSDGASSLMRSGANQRAFLPLPCLLMNACSRKRWSHQLSTTQGGVSSLMRSGADQRALRPASCLLMNACGRDRRA